MWKIHQETRWSDDMGSTGTAFWMQCEHCGKMKFVKR